jgi:RND family efflux transporter MFP subunit
MSDSQSSMGLLLEQLKMDKTLQTESPRSGNKPLIWGSVVALVLVVGYGYQNNLQQSFFSSTPSQKTSVSNAVKPASSALNGEASNSSVGSDANQTIKHNDMPTTQKNGTQNIQKSTSSQSPLDATGYLFAKRQATVSSQITGRLSRILVEEGDIVETNQLLASLDSKLLDAQLLLARSQLESIKHSLSQTKVLLAEAKSRFARTEEIAKKKLNSIEQYENDRFNVLSLEARLAKDHSEVEIARRQIDIQQELLKRSFIHAPFSGVVIEQSAQVGEIVSPISAGGGFTRTGICTLVDLESLEGEVHVNERFIERVYQGQKVVLTAHAYPQLKVSGVVSAIMPTVNKETAAIKVRIALSERDRRLLPNMGIDVTFVEAN